jgi:hypothetical protein
VSDIKPGKLDIDSQCANCLIPSDIDIREGDILKFCGVAYCDVIGVGSSNLEAGLFYATCSAFGGSTIEMEPVDIGAETSFAWDEKTTLCFSSTGTVTKTTGSTELIAALTKCNGYLMYAFKNPNVAGGVPVTTKVSWSLYVIRSCI